MILIGVGLEVLATMAGTIGKQLLRFSKLAEVEGRATCATASLASGLLLNILGGPVLEVLAYGQAPQTLLAPLSGLDVMWNLLLVPYTLHERPTRRQAMGCVLIVVGTALTAISGPHTEEPYSVERMRHQLLTMDALTYVAVEIGLLAAGFLFMSRRPHGCKRRGLVLGLVAGGIGGNLFCMKATASLIQATWQGGVEYCAAVWLNPLPLAVLASAVVIGLGSAFLLAQAMREYEATMMVATYEGAFVISGCASGCAVLGELDVVSPERRVLYAMGVSLVVCGVFGAQGIEVVRSNPASLSNSLEDNDHHEPLLTSVAAA